MKLAVRHLLMLDFIQAHSCTLTELYSSFTRVPAEQLKEWDMATTYSRFSKDISHLKTEKLVHQGPPGLFNRRVLTLTPSGIRYLQTIRAYFSPRSLPLMPSPPSSSSPNTRSSQDADDDLMEIFSDYLGDAFATQHRAELLRWMKMLIHRKNTGDVQGMVQDLLDVLPLSQEQKVAVTADLEKICQLLVTKHRRIAL